MRKSDKTPTRESAESLAARVAQYVHFGEVATAHEQRTETANRFPLSVNVAILTGAGIALKEDVDLGVLGSLTLGAAAIAVTSLWYFTLKSHRQINVAKHEVLQEMERELPASPYSDEWYDKLNEGKTYKPIGAIALYMPWIFSAIYIAIVLLLLTD